jgi:hypothetical protein
MPGVKAGDRLADLLLPYCRRVILERERPDHENGWWFTAAPPDVVREAFTLLLEPPGTERPNDQPPETWLVEQAALRGGGLAGFVAPAGPDSPRMRVDAIIVACAQATSLATEIAKLWPVDYGGTALDLAVVEGCASADTDRYEWGCPGSEFIAWRASSGDVGWLGAAYCSFWWD